MTTWQEPRYFGKHEKSAPIENTGRGYTYIRPQFQQFQYPLYPYPELQLQQIPVHSVPDYTRSPQVAAWVAPEQPTLRQRLKAWLAK